MLLSWRIALRQLCPVAFRSHLLDKMQAVRPGTTTEDRLEWTAATEDVVDPCDNGDDGDCDVSASFTLPSAAFPFQPSVSTPIDDVAFCECSATTQPFLLGFPFFAQSPF
ncbi:unnamed protein product [Strongylus vulgaris]|uniref:Uncharacterized protein n=1 Tax=Strongylus vulgaris TaxID=40348 RepID=A0A3P7IJ94_STRVU|nr:unnamed protein product [Strongylus vulgaris]